MENAKAKAEALARTLTMIDNMPIPEANKMIIKAGVTKMLNKEIKKIDKEDKVK